ncbi:hypothetical protein [Helicobacter mehlei]|uniref:hypothetical protein n=1 Tax=Helicobacter mehlei TaxID=2316080 RepID=UPI001F2744FA|nr:hypothetical protein [Helicobacter mehlei]
MFRLLFCLVLAVCGVGAMGETPLMLVATKIKNLMQKGNQDAMPGYDLIRSEVVQDSIPTLEELGLEFMHKISLFKKLKPKNEAEERFVTGLKKFEILHVLALIYGLILDEKNEDHQGVLTLSQVVQDYLKVLDFIYTPLIQAHQAGLDLSIYATTLSKNPLKPSDFKDLIQYFLKNEQVSPKPVLPVQAFFKDFRVAELAYDLTQHHFYNTLLGPSIGWDYADAYILVKFNAGKEFGEDNVVSQEDYTDLYKLYYAHYATRLLEFLDESYYYTFDDPLSSPELDIGILQKHPHLCLKPKYLRQKFQQACLDIFEKHTYDAQALQHSLQNLPLVSINNAPCLYNTQGKWQKIKSKDILCLALQKIP